MTEAEILRHLRNRVPLTLGRVSPGGIGQRILDALKELVGTAGIDVETVIAAAKRYYDEATSGDNPSIPNLFEAFIENLIWMAIERAIRRLFANQPMP